MKQQKEHWVKTLFSFAGPCKGKMTLSVLCAILSVAGGFVPFWAVYEILLLFINRTATLNNIMLWCLVGVGGYLIRVICFGISTILAHISAYTILEGIRLKIANRLMRAPLGEVMGRRIGYLKNIIMDKVEDLEPPLAHMIPELTSNLLLPVGLCSPDCPGSVYDPHVLSHAELQQPVCSLYGGKQSCKQCHY